MANRTATVVTEGLKLHASMAGEEILDELSKGDKLEILDVRQGKQLQWMHVRVLKAHSDAVGKLGYVAAHGSNGSAFVAVDAWAPPHSPPPAPPKPPVVIVGDASEWWMAIPVGLWLCLAGGAAVILVYWLVNR